MTRQFGTETVIVPGDGRNVWLRARLDLTSVDPADQAAHAQETARTVPHSSLAGAAAVFAALGGESGDWRAYADGIWIVQPLPKAALAEPWRAAIIANLADFATHPSDDEIRLFDRIEIAAPALAGVTIAGAMDNLAQRMTAARTAMTTRLPAGFYLDEYSGSAWPEEADAYVFDVAIMLKRSLDASAAVALTAQLEALETMVAWMGFATEGTAHAWVDQGAMVFAGEARAVGSVVSIRAERPPSDIALALELVAALASGAGNAVAEWLINISPGD